MFAVSKKLMPASRACLISGRLAVLVERPDRVAAAGLAVGHRADRDRGDVEAGGAEPLGAARPPRASTSPSCPCYPCSQPRSSGQRCAAWAASHSSSRASSTGPATSPLSQRGRWQWPRQARPNSLTREEPHDARRQPRTLKASRRRWSRPAPRRPGRSTGIHCYRRTFPNRY